MKHKKLLTVLAFTLILALMLNACSLLYPAGKVKDLIDKIAFGNVERVIAATL